MGHSEDASEFTITYSFALGDGTTLTHPVTIDSATLISTYDDTAPPPDWAKLDHGECSQCEYSGGTHCPIALRMVKPLALVKKLISHESVMTTVTTEERTHSKQTDVQDALRSLFGLIMATSGCPSMTPFKLMARFHLPFSSLEETIFRVTSAYFIGQYFRSNNPRDIPIDMAELDVLYKRMLGVTTGIVARIRKAVEADGALNAMVIFNSFSQLIPIVMEEELDKLRTMFK